MVRNPQRRKEFLIPLRNSFPLDFQKGSQGIRNMQLSYRETKDGQSQEKEAVMNGNMVIIVMPTTAITLCLMCGVFKFARQSRSLILPCF